MICKHCGKEISDQTLYCGYCGAKVIHLPVEEEVQPSLSGHLIDHVQFKQSYLQLIWEMVLNPFRLYDLPFQMMFAIVILNTVVNIWLTRSAVGGVFISFFVGGGIYLLRYFDTCVGQEPKDLLNQASSILFMPTVFGLLAALLIEIKIISVLWVWAMLMSMAIALTAVLMTMKRKNKYIVMVVMSMIYAVVLFVMVRRNIADMFSSYINTIRLFE